MVIARDGKASWACATVLAANNPPEMPIIVAIAAQDLAKYDLVCKALPGVAGALVMVSLLIKKYLVFSPERNIEDLK
jgi:hypothetical protein